MPSAWEENNSLIWISSQVSLVQCLIKQAKVSVGWELKGHFDDITKVPSRT